ncbi:alkaline phosphatase PhoX [Klebsiella pneumoniae]
MSSPLKSVFKKEHSDEISNHSVNPVFSEVVSAFMSRRRFLQMGMVAGAAVSFPYLVKPENAFAAKANPSALSKAVSLGFTSIPVSTADTVTVPEGYIAVRFIAGAMLGHKGNLPEFKFDASNTTDEQAAQAGMHHDGMAWFSLPQGKENPAHGLLALNHEYIDNGMLFKYVLSHWDLIRPVRVRMRWVYQLSR